MENRAKLLLAVDPGKTGVLAFKIIIGEDSTVGIKDCPEDLKGIKLLMSATCISAEDRYGIIERICPQPKFKCTTNSKLGENFGAWQMAFEFCDVKYQIVTAQTWQKIIGGEQGSHTKEKSWRFARRMYPDLADLLGDKVPTKKSSTKESNRADALCILKYMERLNGFSE